MANDTMKLSIGESQKKRKKIIKQKKKTEIVQRFVIECLFCPIMHSSQTSSRHIHF